MSSVSLYWTASSLASSYSVYYKLSSDQNATSDDDDLRLHSVTTDTRATIANLESGKSYEVVVHAINNSDDEEIVGVRLVTSTLSAGAVAGISIGVVVIALAAAGLAFFLIRRRNLNRSMHIELAVKEVRCCMRYLSHN